MKKNFILVGLSLAFTCFLVIGAGVMNSDPQNKDLGVGPVKHVELGPIDAKMASTGKSIFNSKCILCHELNQVKIGPPLGNITKELAPEFIMNLMLNTAQMQKEDASLKALIIKYNNVTMPPPGLNQTQARSVLEYLRSVAK